MIEFTLNGENTRIDVSPDTPLLWVIRENAGLTGTKFGCGIGACGACTVHLNGQAVRSCVTPVSIVQGMVVTTIEGLSAGAELHPVQSAWLQQQIPQCGYCQSGMIMAVSSFLASHPQPTDEDIDAGISNICRCGTYERIRVAIHHVAKGTAVDSNVTEEMEKENA